jgi:hypothetical protein
MGWGKVDGPESNFVGTPDYYATKKWNDAINPPKDYRPPQPALANGMSLGAVLIFLVGIVVVVAFRKALLKVAGVAVLLYGLYLVFK